MARTCSISVSIGLGEKVNSEVRTYVRSQPAGLLLYHLAVSATGLLLKTGRVSNNIATMKHSRYSSGEIGHVTEDLYVNS